VQASDDSGSDESSITAVIDGDVAFAVGDPTFSPIASQRGAKTRVIAGILNRMPFCGVTFKQEISVISEPRQLGEYSVATFPSPSMAYTVQSQMFKEGGLRPNIRQIEFGSLLRALESDAADIVLDIEPNVSIAVREGARVLYSLAARYGEISVVGVIVSEETIDKNKQDVEALVQAIDEAEQFAYVNPSDIESFAVKRFSQLDPYAVGAAIARMLKNNALPRTAEISQNAWKNAIQLRVQSGELVSLNDAMAYRDMSFIPK